MTRTDAAVDRAATLEALPGYLKDGVSAGMEVLKPFTPEGQTARLKAQTDLLQAKKDLAKAQAPQSKDPLSDLKAEVERIELEARRARAETIISDPTTSLVQISIT